MGFFKIAAQKKLSELPIGTRIDECDFACVVGDTFVQLEYVEETHKVEPYKVTPGIWTIKKSGGMMVLRTTEFSDDKLLDSFIHTKNITDKVDSFFSRLHVYKQFGIEIPKRTMLLWGPAGTGKSSIITKVAQKYAAQNDVAVVIWKTDVLDPNEVKEFIKTFEYVGVSKLIFIAEDIGGVEIDQVRIKSESSLLSLLDNQEKAFRIPVLMLITTNYPENLLANLTNRPQRIDDKFEIGFPKGDARYQLMKFFGVNDLPSEEVLEKIRDRKFEEFTPAHIKEIYVRAAIYDLKIEDAMDQIQKEIEHFKNLFQNKIKMGIAVEKQDYYD